MSKKISAFGVLAGDAVDMAADIIPINDVSVAASLQNKIITPIELKVALQGLRVPSLTTLNYTANGTSSVMSSSYNAAKGLSLVRTDGGTAGERVSLIGKTVPASSPWTANAKIQMAIPVLSGSTIFAGGMCLYNTGSSKFICFGLQYLNGTIKRFSVYYTGLNTFSADITTVTVNPPYPVWFQIVESATTYTFNYSYDSGITWLLHGTALKASYFTADRVGVAMTTSSTVAFNNTSLVEHYDDPDVPL